MSDRENARKSILERVQKTENDNVLRSMVFILGDYEVNKDGEERANYIAAILLKIVGCAEIKNLRNIYTVAGTLAEIEAEKAV